LPPPMQGSLPAGGLRLCREGVEPSGSLRKVSDLHALLLSRTYPDASWAHTRRKFFDVHEATGSPIADEALRRIAELYVIERSIRGRAAEERRRVRDSRSRPLVEAMKPWLEAQLGRIPGRSGLANAIRYTLSRWPALCHFLDDGRIELDNNSVERAIRPVALGRKNHLFAGSDGGAERWATVCSLIASAKLNDVEPFAYLRDIPERMTDGHPKSRLDELLPWNWSKMRVNH
jgi:transposase